jgi:hypothetical protein
MMRRFWKSVSIEKSPEGTLTGLFEKRQGRAEADE